MHTWASPGQKTPAPDLDEVPSLVSPFLLALWSERPQEEGGGAPSSTPVAVLPLLLCRACSSRSRQGGVPRSVPLQWPLDGLL